MAYLICLFPKYRRQHYFDTGVYDLCILDTQDIGFFYDTRNKIVRYWVAFKFAKWWLFAPVSIH
ncbi:hypothetical protein B3C1_03740 [Gallaecimonas xiamenensis 3-C-1]|uniref:Uncharacterized protein n=1 Tax=Gallaecimonas xiamenensis 3-C-1 TaxID=745411 RepID=K2KHG1_9GAMM|nr:hypothetical protein B3C1_03740 [Gallaecimonas xiamenensis 3-C-1]